MKDFPTTVEASTEESTQPPLLGGAVRSYFWNYKGKPITATYEVVGEGKPVLLLPALSTISTRAEMRGLANLLSDRYQVVALDWVGFGQSDRPAITYTAAFYQTLLKEFVRSIFSEPVVVIAAGHSVNYVMELVSRQPPLWSWVVLVAPTWRGPLPTAMGERRKLYKLLQRAIRLPIVGQLLYWLTTLPPFLRLMSGRHVLADRQHLTRDWMRQKWRTTQQPGARFASAAFVTGGLDALRTQEQWLTWFQPLPLPVLVVIGEQVPPKSRTEMEVLAHFTAVQVYRMPGSLGLHEEYPEALGEAVLPFLNKWMGQTAMPQTDNENAVGDRLSKET
ncbi:MAG TPA: alpha/beta hydrolase [Thermosynechococcaceae cyanobacterium]